MRRLPLLAALFLVAALMLTFACRADYDPAAETERLIENAKKDIVKDKEAIVAVDRDMKKISQAFDKLREAQKSVDDILVKVRHTNVNNTTKMAFKAGLNFTKVLPTEQIAEAATDFAFEQVADYLNGKFPNSMTGQITQNVGQAKDASIAAVQKFNWTVSLSEQELSGYLRMENKDLAAKEGSLDDNLIILKHSQLILQSGNLAVSQLSQLMKALLERHKELARLKGALENDIKRLEEDIRAWNRVLELNGIIKSNNQSSSAPPPATFPSNPNYDFGTAAGNMRDAYAKLSGGTYGCGSYHEGVWNAYRGAQQKLGEMLTPIYQSVSSACASGSAEACQAAWARASAAAARVYHAFDNQVQSALKQVQQDARAEADGPLNAFARNLHKWGQTEIDIVMWGEEHKLKLEGQRGDWVAMAIWQYALSSSAGGAISQRYYAQPLRQLLQQEKMIQGWLDDSKASRDWFQQRFDSARRSGNMAGGLSPMATQFASTLQPKIELWGCFQYEGLNRDESVNRLNNTRYEWDRLKVFDAAYKAVAKDGEDAGKQLIDAANKNLEQTTKVVEALRGIGSVKASADRLVAASREIKAAQEGNLNISGGHIYNILGNYHISDTRLKALEKRIESLNTQELLEKEALSTLMGMPGYDHKNQVLNPEGIANLKTNVNRALASIDGARDRYAAAYKAVQEAESSLDASLQAMRDKLTPIFPEQVPYFFKEEVLGDYSGPEDYLPLLLRDRTGPPERLPDSSLGTGPLIERYTVLAARYHALVDPHIPAARAGRYATNMEHLLKKFRAESGRLQGMNNNDFMKESNRWSNEAYQIYERASNEGRVEPKSRLSVAYGAIISALSEISSAYYQRQRLAEAQSLLKGAIDSINNFLGNPDAMGGWSAAQTWMDSIGHTKNQVDSSVRSHASIQPLMGQLDGFVGRLREVASRVDAGTLQRDTQAIAAMYQEFANAYQTRNLRALTRFLARGWQTADGSDINDLETTVGNSFRVFESIAFKISGMSIQRVGTDYQVSYQASLTGRIPRTQKAHEDKSRIVDTVIITPDGPRIARTSGILR